ncbi:transglutaminase-like domain-containing protein [Pelobacter propionicus]|nr:transglutaminase-like domain-containing protein [Pelobacter propionicus]
MLVALHDPAPITMPCPVGPDKITTFPDGFVSSAKLAEVIGSMFPGETVVVSRYDNSPLIRSRYPFSYQPSSDPRLASLREKYGLSKLAVTTDDDFLQIITILDWVHGQWVHGTSGADAFAPGEFDAGVILSHSRHGKRFWCHVYAMTFIQVASALGHQARLVSLTKDGYESSDMHAIAEVWSNRYVKWVAVDPDFNIWYERDAMPLSVLEIHNAVMDRTTDRITIVKGRRRADAEFERRIPILFNYYRCFNVDMRNDWLSNRYFPGHPRRSDVATLFWDDRRLPPVLTLMTKINHPHALYWDINKTHVSFVRSNKSTRTIPIYMDTVTPNYSHFEITVDDAFRISEKSARFNWKLHKGRNSLTVCSVNSFGHRGVPVKVTVDVGLERGK